jgi:hypothetical protein
VVAGIAHGLKGLGVGAETPGPALIRLLHWLEDAGEELTASVELRDAIAYLDYLPYARLTPDDVPAAPTAGRAAAEAARKRFGLHALLLTCGYNPTVLDLEAVDDLDLAQFPVAVFPSLGYLGVDAYGKLVVFTLHGGSLITLPEPAVREVDGTPLNTRFLWPHPAGQGPPRWSATLLPWRSRLRRAGTGESVPFSGRCLTFPAAGRPFVRYGRTGAGEVPRAATEAVTAQVLMTAGGVPAAYRVQVRSGTSTVVGAALGAEYLTPAYARLAPAARRTLRRVLLNLFEETTPRQIVPDDHLDLEAIARLSPDGGSLLFVINRLGGQSGRLHFPVPESLNIGRHPTATVLFSGAGSTATGRAGGVTLDLAPGDAMVLRLT